MLRGMGGVRICQGQCRRNTALTLANAGARTWLRVEEHPRHWYGITACGRGTGRSGSVSGWRGQVNSSAALSACRAHRDDSRPTAAAPAKGAELRVTRAVYGKLPVITESPPVSYLEGH
jgi:hypothetical protein